MKTTLSKIARLYDLVGEMRTIIAELREVHVEVRIGQQATTVDPMAVNAAVRVTMFPGCKALEGS